MKEPQHTQGRATAPTTRTSTWAIVLAFSTHPAEEYIEELTDLTWSECVDGVSRLSQWKANCESTRGVQVQVRVVLERQSHSQKRAMSTRPLKLAVEESMTTFDQPETWSERA